MSAFFAAIDHQQTEFDAPLAARLLAPLERYGCDQGTLTLDRNVAVGQHVSQAERHSGEIKLITTDAGEYFLFDGRVDNRSELLEELTSVGIALPLDVGDARLFQTWFARFGAARLQTVVGPFSFVLLNPDSGCIDAARDPMGGRGLSYCIEGSLVCFATDESVYSCIDGFPPAFCQDKLARHLLLMMDDEPKSFLANAQVVRPGEMLRYQDGVVSRRRYYRAQFDPQVYRQGLAENAQRFRQLFDQAVQRRLNTAGVTGIMLSGGLDSVPLAISAQRQSIRPQSELVAFSWVFPQTPEADESHISAPLCHQLNVARLTIDCDATPPRLIAGLPVDPRVPFSLPFVAYQKATLERAQAQGVTVMLTGMHGDLLYLGAKDVVYRALAKGRWRLALAEFLRLRQLSGSTLVAIKRYLLMPLGAFQWASTLIPKANPRIQRMLSASLANSVSKHPHWLHTESLAFPRPEQYQKLFDAFAGEDALHARFNGAPHGVEYRYPLRDRELCEFVLSVPSEQLYHLGEVRPLLKRAFAAELPDAVAQRNDKTLFTAPVIKQIEADHSLLTELEEGETQWSQYVKKSYFSDPQENYDLRQLALWRCAYYNFWRKHVASNADVA